VKIYQNIWCLYSFNKTNFTKIMTDNINNTKSLDDIFVSDKETNINVRLVEFEQQREEIGEEIEKLEEEKFIDNETLSMEITVS